VFRGIGATAAVALSAALSLNMHLSGCPLIEVKPAFAVAAR
jgi:hypothetical protein